MKKIIEYILTSLMVVVGTLSVVLLVVGLIGFMGCGTECMTEFGIGVIP